MIKDAQQSNAGVDVAGNAQQKPTMLSYNPATLPDPVVTSDFYARAALVQLRVLTKSVDAIAAALAELTQKLAATHQQQEKQPTTEEPAVKRAASSTSATKRANSSKG